MRGGPVQGWLSWAVPGRQAPARRDAGAGRAIVEHWSLAFGELRHARHRPVGHAFRYRAFFASGCASALDGSPHGNWLFGINRPALLSFHERDHGDGAGVQAWLHGLLAQAGIRGVTRVRYEGFVRVFGHAFKPVSFWHCARDDGQTIAIVAEVNNTFGERHSYLLSAPGSAPLPPGRALLASKAFHVSPFFPVSGTYRFRFGRRDARTLMRIDLLAGAGEDEGESARATDVLLATSMSGELRALTPGCAAHALLRYPLFSLGVIARIHWHALRLFVKRVRHFSKPQPPAALVTSGRPAPFDHPSRRLRS